MSPFCILKRCYFRIKADTGSLKRDARQCPRVRKKELLLGEQWWTRGSSQRREKAMPHRRNQNWDPCPPELQPGRLLFCSVKSSPHSPYSLMWLIKLDKVQRIGVLYDRPDSMSGNSWESNKGENTPQSKRLSSNLFHSAFHPSLNHSPRKYFAGRWSGHSCGPKKTSGYKMNHSLL